MRRVPPQVRELVSQRWGGICEVCGIAPAVLNTGLEGGMTVQEALAQQASRISEEPAA